MEDGVGDHGIVESRVQPLQGPELVSSALLRDMELPKLESLRHGQRNPEKNCTTQVVSFKDFSLQTPARFTQSYVAKALMAAGVGRGRRKGP